MVKINKLMKNDKFKVGLVLAVLVGVVLIGDPFGMRGFEREYNISTLGSVDLYDTVESTKITSTTYVVQVSESAGDKLTVIFIPDSMNAVTYVDAYIYEYSGSYSYSGGSLQKAAVEEKSDRYVFTFDLGPLPPGQDTYFVGFSGEMPTADETYKIIVGELQYFYIDKAGDISYADPIITEGPSDESVVVGDTVSLLWRYESEGPVTLNLRVNGDLEDTRTFGGYTTEQVYTYSFTPIDELTYNVVFEVEPDSVDNIVVSDTVVINGLPPVETTTTTTTETETTTTETETTTDTTTTDTPPPEETDYTNILIIAGAAGAGIVVILLIRRKPSMGY